MTRYLIFFFLLSESISSFAYSKDNKIYRDTTIQKAITTNQSEAQHNCGDGCVGVDEDFNFFLFTLALIATAFILVLIGIGIILTIALLGIIFLLTSFGILSTSIIVGIQQKSFQKGFKTFMVLIFGLGGTIVGLIAFGLWNKIVHWWSLNIALAFGASCGLTGGVLFGLIATLILQKIGNFLKLKIEEQKQNISTK